MEENLQQPKTPTKADYEFNLFDPGPSPAAIAAAEAQRIQANNYNTALQDAQLSPAQRLQFQRTSLNQDIGQGIKSLLSPGDSPQVKAAKERAGLVQDIIRQTSGITDQTEKLQTVYELMSQAGLANDAERVAVRLGEVRKRQADLLKSEATTAGTKATTAKTIKDNSDLQRVSDDLAKQDIPPDLRLKALEEYKASGTLNSLKGVGKLGDPVYGAEYPLTGSNGKPVIENGQEVLAQKILAGPGVGKIRIVNDAPKASTTNVKVNVEAAKQERSALEDFIKINKLADDSTKPYKEAIAGLAGAQDLLNEGRRTKNYVMAEQGVRSGLASLRKTSTNDQTSAGERAEAAKEIGLLENIQESVARGVLGKNTDEYYNQVQAIIGKSIQSRAIALRRETDNLQRTMDGLGASGAVMRGIESAAPKGMAAPTSVQSTDRDFPTIVGPKVLKAKKDERTKNDVPNRPNVVLPDGLMFQKSADGVLRVVK